MIIEDMTARRVTDAARRWLGTPYRHQASSLGIGCDCLGLVRGVWREVYGCEPDTPGPYSRDWAETGPEDRLLEAARRYMDERSRGEVMAGRLLLFRWRQGHMAKHAGIATGPNRFIHAYEGGAVTQSFLVPSWRRRIAGIFAFPAIEKAD